MQGWQAIPLQDNCTDILLQSLFLWWQLCIQAIIIYCVCYCYQILQRQRMYVRRVRPAIIPLSFIICGCRVCVFEMSGAEMKICMFRLLNNASQVIGMGDTQRHLQSFARRLIYPCSHFISDVAVLHSSRNNNLLRFVPNLTKATILKAAKIW